MIATTLVCIHCGSEYTFGQATSHTWAECANVMQNEIRQLEENLRIYQINYEEQRRTNDALRTRLAGKNRRLSGQRHQVKSWKYAVQNEHKRYRRISEMYFEEREKCKKLEEENQILHEGMEKL